MTTKKKPYKFEFPDYYLIKEIDKIPQKGNRLTGNSFRNLIKKGFFKGVLRCGHQYLLPKQQVDVFLALSEIERIRIKFANKISAKDIPLCDVIRLLHLKSDTVRTRLKRLKHKEVACYLWFNLEQVKNWAVENGMYYDKVLYDKLKGGKIEEARIEE